MAPWTARRKRNARSASAMGRAASPSRSTHGGGGVRRAAGLSTRLQQKRPSTCRIAAMLAVSRGSGVCARRPQS
eukprot:1858540-Alexandrium_andersonii.AAC.1